MIEHRGRSWQKCQHDGQLEGWRAIAKLPPAQAQTILEIWENGLCPEEPFNEDEETDVVPFLRRAGVVFDGEVLSIDCIRTETTRTVLSIIVSCVKFKRE